MTLQNYSVAEVQEWENKLLSAAGELRKIWAAMQHEGMETVSLEAAEAIKKIDHLPNWAIVSEAKFRQQKARHQAEKARQAIKTARKINPGKS